MTKREELQAELVEVLKELINYKDDHYGQGWTIEVKLREKRFELEQSISQLQEGEGEASYPAKFVEWLKDECDVYFNTMHGQYFWVHKTRDYTTSEAFEYWKSRKT